MFLSVFDLFKIGIGPSSSHTMGPMVAARRFLDEIAGDDWPRPTGATVARLAVSLHGSLAFTGVGHATDRATVLGLAGETPLTVDPDRADAMLAEIAEKKAVSPPGHPDYRFDPGSDLVFDRKQPLPGHANGMAFRPLMPMTGC
jgi:L-serine dehydratase